MENKAYFLHKTAVFSLFVLGDWVILLPAKNSTDKTLLGFLLAAFVGVILLFSLNYLFKKVQNKTKLREPIITFIYVVILVYSLYLAVTAFNVFMDFVLSYVLNGFSELFVAFVFLIVVFCLAFSKREVLYKLGVVTGFVSVGLIILLFVFSFNQFSVDNISLLSMPSIADVLSDSTGFIKCSVLPAIILLFWQDNYNKKECSVVYGYICGLGLQLLIILNCLLIFGSRLSAKLDYPYSEAIATVTAGNIFTRMDGFSYFVFFISCLVKITVCFKISFSLIKKVYYKVKKLK